MKFTIFSKNCVYRNNNRFTQPSTVDDRMKSGRSSVVQSNSKSTSKFIRDYLHSSACRRSTGHCLTMRLKQIRLKDVSGFFSGRLPTAMIVPFLQMNKFSQLKEFLIIKRQNLRRKFQRRKKYYSKSSTFNVSTRGEYPVKVLPLLISVKRWNVSLK